ncbi:MAG: hypothetical protein EOM14_07980, partial [Clostridia bacterium]|nr:hypothetical protein [Clostridia bacterium]
MYSYNYDYDLYRGLYHMSAGTTIFSLLISALAIAALWILFKKAGEDGWAAIVPFYNAYVLFKITWGSGWKFLLMLIPIANFVIMIITYVKLAQAFGKGGGWACGLIFLPIIFLPIMAFSKEIVYVGVPGQTQGYAPGYGPAGYQQPYSQGYQQQGYQPPYQQPYSQPNGYQAPNPQQNTYQQSTQNPDYFYQQTTAPNGPKYCSGCGAPIDANVK